MRLNKYLNEGQIGIKINHEEMCKTLVSKCGQILKNYKSTNTEMIFKGIQGTTGDWLKVDPKAYKRISANTNNFYTILIDEYFPKWKQYPKRSNSLICTTDQGVASNYGTCYLIFPYDNAKIGICSSEDMWYSFKGISDLGIFIENLYETIKYYTGKALSNNPNVNDLIYALKETDIEISKNPWQVKQKDIQYKIPKLLSKINYGSLMKFLNDTLGDPGRNEFKLANPGYKFPEDKEVWTDSECIMIAVDYIYNNKDISTSFEEDLKDFIIEVEMGAK